MIKKTILETEMFTRTGSFDRAAMDEEKRTVELSFSSEEPYQRYFGVEILDHAPESVDMTFLNSGNAPLLLGHWRDDHIGVVERAWIGDDRRGYALVRFGKGAQADEVFSDVQDGIRSNVSVGYQVKKMRLEETDDENETYRVIDWMPMEVSIVSIPADASVGVGRDEKPKYKTTIIQEVNEMADEKIKKTDEEDAVEIQAAKDKHQAEVRAANDAADTVRKIREAGQAYDRQEKAAEFIANGKSYDEFMRFVADDLRAKDKLVPLNPEAAEIGMTAKEKKNYSLLRLINSMAPNMKVEAGFEREVSNELSKKMGKAPQGAFVPADVLVARDLNTTDDAAMVATAHLAGSFIDVLRNKMILAQAGVTFLPGLVGNVSIPRMSAASTAYWVAEGSAPTESEATFDAVTLSPKCCGTYTDITRSMQLQSTPAIEQVIRGDLTKTIALGIETAALHGTGSNDQPTGVAATGGIGSVTGGTNGAAPDWGDVIDLETAVAQDNADIGALAYVTNAKVRGKLKQTLVTSTYGDRMVWGVGDAPLNGYPALVTNSVSSALTKGSSSGVCSAIFFGNWADLLVGMWGVPDILVDPYTASAAGSVRVRILQDIDIAVRHAESFAAMLDATTT
jgi:HK97 family phage major capsid protein